MSPAQGIFHGKGEIAFPTRPRLTLRPTLAARQQDRPSGKSMQRSKGRTKDPFHVDLPLTVRRGGNCSR